MSEPTGSVTGVERRGTQPDRRQRMRRARDRAVAGGHHRLELLVALSAILSIAALVYALVAQNGQISDLTRGEQRAARDSCRLVRGLVLDVPPARLAAQRAFVARSPLHDCQAYARGVIEPPKKGARR